MFISRNFVKLAAAVQKIDDKLNQVERGLDRQSMSLPIMTPMMSIAR